MARQTVIARLLPIGEVGTPEIPAPVVGPATINSAGARHLLFKHLLAVRCQQLHAERGPISRKEITCHHRALRSGQLITYLVYKYPKHRLLRSQAQQVELVEPNAPAPR